MERPRLSPHSTQADAPHFSRRGLLAAGAILALGRIGAPVIDQKFDEWNAGVDNFEFVEKYRDQLKQIRLGASFSPEEFGISRARGVTDSPRYQRAMEALRFGINDLGLRDIRLGVKWENAEDLNGTIDFSFYEPFVDQMLQNNVNICLDIGYKTQRWPEQHPPRRIEESDLMLAFGATVTPHSDLGREALSYTEDLCAFLEKKYGDIFDMVHPENEPFQRFGKFEHKLSENYMRESIRIIQNFFPTARILVNGGGATAVKQAAIFVADMIERDEATRDKLVLGIDVHRKKPDQNIVAKKLGLDTLTTDRIVHGDVYEWNKDFARQRGYQVEITEAQIEDWGNETDPLYKVKDLREVLVRCFDILPLGQGQREFVVRLWGLEAQFEEAQINNNGQTEKRLELIRSISALKNKSAA